MTSHQVPSRCPSLHDNYVADERGSQAGVGRRPEAVRQGFDSPLGRDLSRHRPGEPLTGGNDWHASVSGRLQLADDIRDVGDPFGHVCLGPRSERGIHRGRQLLGSMKRDGERSAHMLSRRYVLAHGGIGETAGRSVERLNARLVARSTEPRLLQAGVGLVPGLLVLFTAAAGCLEAGLGGGHFGVRRTDLGDQFLVAASFGEGLGSDHVETPSQCGGLLGVPGRRGLQRSQVAAKAGDDALSRQLGLLGEAALLVLECPQLALRSVDEG